MLTIARMRIRALDLDDLRELSRRHHWGWPGPVFSVNSRGQIWPFACNGHTHEADRWYVEGLSPVLDAVAMELLETRPPGGRFFINEKGAFFKPDSAWIQFAEFSLR